MISYLDDFVVTAASPSYRGKIYRVQEFFEKLEAKARYLKVSFPIDKMKLIHWTTPS